MVLLKTLISFGLLMLTGCNRFFFHPDSQFYFSPEKNGFHASEAWFTAEDGTRLHAWHFDALQNRSSNKKGLIVQFHGNAENISSHFTSLVWLTREGYDLLSFDYRGYGQSEGKATDEGLAQDSLAALTFSKKIYETMKSSTSSAEGRPLWIIYGQSLGGLQAQYAVSQNPEAQQSISLLVLDSTFASYKALVQEKMSSLWITWPFQWLGKLFTSDRYASKEKLAHITAPTLIIHDHQDPVVSFKNGQYVFENIAAQPKKFWTLDNADHLGIFFAADQMNENRECFRLLLDRLYRENQGQKDLDLSCIPSRI